MSREYTTMMYISKNEKGVEEIELTYDMSILEWLKASCKAFRWLRLSRTDRWVYNNQWMDKTTGIKAVPSMQVYLQHIKVALLQDNRGYEKRAGHYCMHAQSVEALIEQRHDMAAKRQLDSRFADVERQLTSYMKDPW